MGADHLIRIQAENGEWVGRVDEVIRQNDIEQVHSGVNSKVGAIHRGTEDVYKLKGELLQVDD